MTGAQPTAEGGDTDRRYRFDEFTLDLDRGLLLRAGEEIAVSPKGFEVLAYLVQHHGQLVSKTSLIEAVWRDTAITDNSLAQRLLEIRRALGDDSQQLIRTVARRGYIFTASVSTPVMEFPRHPAVRPVQPVPLQPAVEGAWKPLTRHALAGALSLTVIAGVAVVSVRLALPPRSQLTYTQITNFADSAVAPALSPDGRMLAFIRGEYPFGGPGQIYVKLLPDGEPVQLTHDNLSKGWRINKSAF